MKIDELLESPKITYSLTQQKREDVNKLLNDNFKMSGKYSINDDLTIDVNGSVKLKNKMTKLPIKFNSVLGSFDCSKKGLITLEGCPIKVGRSFWCFKNKLTSLQGCPIHVGGEFQAWENQLTSLHGCPNTIGGLFDCKNNQLTSLEGGPAAICTAGAKDPTSNSYYDCINNPLKSLDGSPVDINGGSFRLSIDKTLPLLRILNINNVANISIYPHNWNYEDISADDFETMYKILNKYKGQGKKGILQCAAELTKAGFKGNARL